MLFSNVHGGSFDTSYFLAKENKLKKDAYLMINGKNDSQKVSSAFKLYNELLLTLESDDSYLYPFDSLKYSTVSIVNAPDNKFRIFSFNAVLTNNIFKQFVIIQSKSKNKIFSAFDTSTTKREYDDYEEYGLDDWNGCLYYKMQMHKRKGKRYYTLLGYDGGNGKGLSHKILDVLHFDKKGIPLLGAPIFKQDKDDYEPQFRERYTFSNQSSFVLHFEPESKMIIFTHLSPNTIENKGKKEFYIADGSYDYYILKKGIWTKYIDLSTFNFKGNKEGNKTPKLAFPDESEAVD